MVTTDEENKPGKKMGNGTVEKVLMVGIIRKYFIYVLFIYSNE